MIAVQITDSKKHQRIVIIKSGFVKPSGLKVAKVITDEGQTYFVQVRPNGYGSCSCKSHRVCYHMKAVAQADLPGYQAVTAKKETKASVSMDEAIAVMTSYVQEVNEPINQVNTCAYCGHDCRGYACVKCIGY